MSGRWIWRGGRSGPIGSRMVESLAARRIEIGLDRWRLVRGGRLLPLG